jgi:hypothetical protein
MCVHEQKIGVSCDALAPAVQSLEQAFGVLGAPGIMLNNSATAALGEMYEPDFFPNKTCPSPLAGAAYGAGIGSYFNSPFRTRTWVRRCRPLRDSELHLPSRLRAARSCGRGAQRIGHCGAAGHRGVELGEAAQGLSSRAAQALVDVMSHRVSRCLTMH